MAQGFGLSPSVSVKEINATGYVPNIPSAKTGAILRADSGPCLDVTALTNENDLLSTFGKPNAANFQDWFQCWNFLQYSSSLYVVRPMSTTTKNAGIGLTGLGLTTNQPKSNFYNRLVAERSLETFVGTDTLHFINKDVTSNQRLAVGVCSTPQYFKSSIGLEFYARLNSTSALGTPVVQGYDSTLVNGSQVLLNNDATTNLPKLATVVNSTQSASASSTITFDRNISAADIAPFWALSASGVSSVVASGGFVTYPFEKAGFSFKVGTAVGVFKNFVVFSIANNSTDNTHYDVTFLNTNTSSAVPLAFTNQEVVYSSNILYQAKTAYNATKGDFGINAGDSTIALQPGYVIEPGVTFTIAGVANTTLRVASVNYDTNVLTLVSPCPSAVNSATSVSLAITTSSTVDNIVTGVNYFDKIYDSSVISKTRTNVLDANNVAKTIVAQSLITFSNLYDFQPNWANNEFALVILRKNDDGYYEIGETPWTLSYDATARDNSGNNIFVENVLYKSSKLLYAKVGNKASQRVDTAVAPLPKILSATDASTIYPVKSEYGKSVYDGYGYTKGDIMNAYTLFADPEAFDINILMCHQLDLNYASTIAETRKDAVGIVAPYDYQFLSVNSANDCTSYLLDNFGSQTEFDLKQFSSFGTYSAVYGNMKYQYDKYNNVNRWINIAGDVAGLYALTDSTNDPWWAPAGVKRGKIRNAIKLAFNPNRQQRDDLYVNAINPIMAIPGEGNAVIWGQKTATATPSAMDRVNVRRLLIFLEKSIATAVNVGLFEFNDTFTRTRLFNILDPFLRSVKNRRGLYDYKVVVDATNNTNQVIDQNGLVIDIYLQPTKVSEFIRVNAIVVPTGATFAEYVGIN